MLKKAILDEIIKKAKKKVEEEGARGIIIRDEFAYDYFMVSVEVEAEVMPEYEYKIGSRSS